jgi:phytoene dehydrogenase-like protein
MTAPDGSATLMLDGDGTGPINHVAPLSAAQPTYAPPGGHLLSATTLGDPGADDTALEQASRTQLAGWFGPRVAKWRLLRIYRIRKALPTFVRTPGEAWAKPARYAPGVYLAGDQLNSPSLQGAADSGVRAAEALLADR